jgi:hypothetical protein
MVVVVEAEDADENPLSHCWKCVRIGTWRGEAARQQVGVLANSYVHPHAEDPALGYDSSNPRVRSQGVFYPPPVGRKNGHPDHFTPPENEAV